MYSHVARFSVCNINNWEWPGDEASPSVHMYKYIQLQLVSDIKFLYFHDIATVFYFELIGCGDRVGAIG